MERHEEILKKIENHTQKTDQKMSFVLSALTGSRIFPADVSDEDVAVLEQEVEALEEVAAEEEAHAFDVVSTFEDEIDERSVVAIATKIMLLYQVSIGQLDGMKDEDFESMIEDSAIDEDDIAFIDGHRREFHDALQYWKREPFYQALVKYAQELIHE